MLHIGLYTLIMLYAHTIQLWYIRSYAHYKFELVAGIILTRNYWREYLFFGVNAIMARNIAYQAIKKHMEEEDKVERVMQKMVIEGDDDLSEEERGILWRKPVNLFTQVADELREEGCLYKCVDVLAEDGMFLVSLQISEKSLIHRCYPHFIFRSPFKRVDGRVYIKYDFTRERDQFAEQSGKICDYLTLGTYYTIRFDAHFGFNGISIRGVLFLMKDSGMYY